MRLARYRIFKSSDGRNWCYCDYAEENPRCHYAESFAEAVRATRETEGSMNEQDEKLVVELINAWWFLPWGVSTEDNIDNLGIMLREAIVRTRKQVWMEAAKDCENRMDTFPTLDGMIIRRTLEDTARRFRKMAEEA